jgi:hypothetical protein
MNSRSGRIALMSMLAGHGAGCGGGGDDAGSAAAAPPGPAAATVKGKFVGCGCLLAAGIATVVAAAPAAASTVSLLNNGGFESKFRNGTFCASLDVTYGPADYGKWAVGDAACSVTGPAFSITPLGGARMLDFGSIPEGNTSSDVYQIVDLTAYATEIDAGLVTVDTSAYFDSTTAARVGLALLRWANPPATFGGFQFLKSGFGFTTDSDRSTWQEFGYSGVSLSAGTRYLGFGLNSPVGAPQTYVDNATLLLHIDDGQTSPVPEPSTLSLVLASGIGFLASRRRRMGQS